LYREKKKASVQKNLFGVQQITPHGSTRAFTQLYDIGKAVLFGRVVPRALSGKLFSCRFSLCGTGCRDISHVTYYNTELTVCQEIPERNFCSRRAMVNLTMEFFGKFNCFTHWKTYNDRLSAKNAKSYKK